MLQVFALSTLMIFPDIITFLPSVFFGN